MILEGISLNLLLGENGIVTTSKDIEETHTIARLSEKLELLKGPILIDRHGVNLQTYLLKLKEVEEEYKVKYIDVVDSNNAYIVLEEKYIFLITDTEDGNVVIIYQGIAGELLSWQ